MSNINFKDGPINYNGIWSLIKQTNENNCRTCDLDKRKKNNTICEDCPFRFNSSYDSTTRKRTRVYPGNEFKQFGLKNLPAMGKHTLFYFLDHPELDFIWPELPDEDRFGNISKRVDPENGKNFLWHLHHKNKKFYDDSKNNLERCLNTEHARIEHMEI